MVGETETGRLGQGAFDLGRALHRWRVRLAISRRDLRSNEIAQIVVCALMGAAVGAVVTVLRELIDRIHHVSFKLPAHASLSTGIGMDPLRILIVPAAGGLLLGVSALISRRLRSAEIVDPIEANALYGGRMSLIDSLRLVGATLISNACGASLGMEAGYSQLGAGVFSRVGQYLRLRRADLRVFVTAGAAAAIAAAFNAPLAGAFYGYELVLGSYTPRAIAPVAVAALVSTLVQRGLVDTQPLFVVAGTFHTGQWTYLLFVLLGLLAAPFSILAMNAVTWADRSLKFLRVPLWARPMLGGLMLSTVAVLAPQVLGSGHGAIQFHLDHRWGVIPLFLVLAAKLIASAVSVGSGYRGGMFSSSLFLGCLFGALIAQALCLIFPSLAPLYSSLAIVGMGAVAAAVIGAPFTMVFLVLELTGDFPITVAVLVGVVIASTLVRLTFGYSFSTWRFHLRGLPIRGAHDIGWIADLTVGRLMRSDAKIVPGSTTLRQLREQFPPGSTKQVFVVDRLGRYCGMVDMAAVHSAADDPGLDTQTAGDLAVDGGVYLLPGENLRTALLRFEARQSEILPVFASLGDRRIVGYMTEGYALRRYAQELERQRSAELGEQDIFGPGPSRAEPIPKHGDSA